MRRKPKPRIKSRKEKGLMCHLRAWFQLSLHFPFLRFDYMRQHIPHLMHKLVEFGLLSRSTERFNSYRLTLKRILTYRNSAVMEQKSRKLGHTEEDSKMFNQNRRFGVAIFKYQKG